MHAGRKARGCPMLALESLAAHARYLAVRTDPRTALYAVYMETRGLTPPELLRLWGGGNAADGERFGAWKRDLTRKGNGPLEGDRAGFVAMVKPAEDLTAEYALSLDDYLALHPERRKVRVEKGDSIETRIARLKARRFQ